jgi:hypothetical protein
MKLMDWRGVDVHESPILERKRLSLLSASRTAACHSNSNPTSPALTPTSLFFPSKASAEAQDRRHNQAVAIGLMEKERLARMNDIAVEKHNAIEEERLERRRSGDLVQVLEEQARKERVVEYEAMLEARKQRRSTSGPLSPEQNLLIPGF